LHELKRYREALHSFDKAIALQPDCAEVYNSRCLTLHALKLYEQALTSCQQALALKPDYAECLSNLGLIYNDLNRFPEALACHEKALALQPDCGAAFNNRGLVLLNLDRHADALASYRQAIALNPEDSHAYSNRGTVFRELQRFDEALADYEQAIALNPDNPSIYWNKALLKILTGDYAEGWRLYEWRWRDQQQEQVRHYPQPYWLGAESVAGKTVLIYPEQGLGDFIQFCRYALLLEAMGARVVIETPPELVSLLSAAWQDRFMVIPKDQPLPAFDLHCAIMSLPFAFKTVLNSVPAAVPYLYADTRLQENWRTRLGAKTAFRVGLVWSGSTIHKNDRNRSISLKLLEPILNLPLEFHALQKDIRQEDTEFIRQLPLVRDHRSELHSFSDTAALIAEMDLVISVDTSVAHLAGAMAKPVWILLPYAPDYRWMVGRNDSPWYPTARLFRQTGCGDWTEVVAEVARNLADQAVARVCSTTGLTV